MKWQELIGQKRAKDRFDFHFQAFINGEPLPTFLLTAPRGFGKTTMAESFALRVREVTKGTDREKVAHTVNASSIKKMRAFWDNIIIPLVHDREMTLIIDEASELPQDVTFALLTMLQPNENYLNQFSYDQMTVDIDLRRQSFIFCTTEGHRIFPALIDRCQRIDLEDYSNNDLAAILKRHAVFKKGDERVKIEFGPHVLDHVAPVLRGNARQAVHMARDIKTYLAPLKKVEFTMGDWEVLSKKLGILPLGVNPLELRVLRVLQETRDCSLTRIAATLMMTPASVQKDLELYLQKRQLMEVTTTGRNLTAQGYEYLRALDKKP